MIKYIYIYIYIKKKAALSENGNIFIVEFKGNKE